METLTEPWRPPNCDILRFTAHKTRKDQYTKNHPPPPGEGAGDVKRQRTLQLGHLRVSTTATVPTGLTQSSELQHNVF